MLETINKMIEGLKNIGQAKSKPTLFCLRLTDFKLKNSTFSK